MRLKVVLRFKHLFGFVANNNSEFPENLWFQKVPLKSLVLVTPLDSNHKLVRVIYHSFHTARLGNKTPKNSMRAGLASSE